MVAATFRSFVGIAKEVTPGTGVAASSFIAVTDDPGAHDVIDYLPDEGMRGSMVKSYGLVAGVKHGEFELKGNVDLQTIGFPLASLLGDVVTTGAGPFTHVFAVKNSTDGQPPSYSVTDFNGVESRRHTFSRAEEVSFKFNADGLLEFGSKWKSWAPATVADPSPSYSTYVPFANWQACVEIAGSPSLIVQEGELTIKRSVDLLHTLNCGDANPYKLFSGAVEVDGKITVLYEATTELARYLNNTQPALDFLWDVTGAPTDSLKLHMTKAAYKTFEVKRGEQYVQADIEFTAIANSTDVGASGGMSPIKATLINTSAANTYA